MIKLFENETHIVSVSIIADNVVIFDPIYAKRK